MRIKYNSGHSLQFQVPQINVTNTDAPFSYTIYKFFDLEIKTLKLPAINLNKITLQFSATGRLHGNATPAAFILEKVLLYKLLKIFLMA